MKKRLFKSIVAIAVTLALFLQMFPMATFAAEPTSDTRIVDLPTMTDWQNFFGESVLNTENAGGVWGDKSVFLSADDFNDALEDGVADYDIEMNEDSTNFLVALSAIAANKSIVGYSALPTDTMFVLDLSNSMSNASMTSMINATNAAIRKLQSLNLNNRIGVVVYAGTRTSFYGDIFGLNESATVLLPIGRYDGAGSGNNETFLTYSGDTVSVANGVLDLDTGERNPSKSASGATYIQAGMQLAVNEFKAVEDTVIESGPQAGTVRMPVMVLMSDGAPTAATTSINNVGDSNMGSGSSSSSTATTSYVTQLTCAWAKEEMNNKYGRSSLFYTLGLNVGSSPNAKAILDPNNAGSPFTTYWNEYTQAAKNGSATITHSSGNSRFTVPVVTGLEKAYVDEYFPAPNDTGLINAFELIVNQIIIQSKYYPTLVDDGQHHLNGYITFNDELGVFMQVKDIKGLTVDGKLYRGSAIVKAVWEGEFGDIKGGNLANLNSDGSAFLRAVEARLGCTEAQAEAVVSQALLEGQLYYNNDDDFSNYIGWYSNADGKFLGFWNGKDHAAKPDGAVFANKSYGFMGTVGSAEEFNLTDMLHISVQVREHIELEHQSVIYKIPASLIPTVNYNITFDGDALETGTNFEMSVDGAKEALRLVFEVGLRDDINRINVADKVAEYEAATGDTYAHVKDGVYTFYSNSWADHTHSQDHLVDNHDAAWLEFEPSLENERYYYTANSPIYEDVGNGNYQLVDHDPRNTGETYYTRFTLFYTQEVGVSSATMEYHFVPIDSQNTIDLAQKSTDGSWYIPKGTVHRLLADSEGHDYHILKEGEVLTDNVKTHPTETLNYSNYPAVVFLADGSVHCDACLGNNGTFTLTAAQGIKLSKTVEVEGLGGNEYFEFKIALTPPSGETLATSYPVYDEQGEYITDANVENGVLTYSIMAGQTVYITDLPTGTSYTVTENASANWAVANKTNDTGVVAKNSYNDVVFENTPVSHGNLVIHKEVVLPEALGTDAKYGEAFNLEVTLTHPSVLIDNVKVNGVDTAVVNGKLNLTIKDDETILISDIPDGATYTVIETGLPSFWTASQQTNQPAIDDAENTVVNLTNTYNVEKVSLDNVSHTGIKNLLGREWLDTDRFDFTLEYYNGSNWVAYAETESATKAGKTFSFDDTLKNLTFDKVGTYHFRVIEQYTEIGGVDYDYIPKRFEIEVVNNFDTGKLEIANVKTTTPKPEATTENPTPAGTVITKNGDNYEISTTFNNLYSVSGTANAVIEITKELENQTGVARDKSGFEFELYQLDGNNKINVEKIGPTDETGTLVYGKAWGATFVGQTLTYYLAEVDLGEDGMVYDLTPRKIEVAIIDNLDGTVSAKVNGQESNSNIFSATFTNTYELSPADVEISGTKTMLGRDLNENDTIKFELYKTDENFENGVLVDTATLSNGAFSLTDGADTAGEKYYIVKEKASGLAGVEDDDSIYYVTAEVKKGEGDALVSQIKSILKGDLPAETIAFENVYTPNPENYIIKGTKNLTGRDIVNGEFSFVLKDAEGKVLQTKEVKDGKFEFDPIEIEKKGEYVFTVSEVKGNAEGVTYDQTVYTVTLTVADDGKANLTIEDEISTDTADGLEEIVFKNIYTAPVVEQPQPPIDIPKTGDYANLSGWAALFFISGGVMISLVAYNKKRKSKEN